jgi:D-glucosaminate-6-phosphate ammonia-lyase
MTTLASELRGRRVINGRGYSTKVGGCRLAPEIVAAMAEAADYFVRMEDLEDAAGREIARLTGAEAGYVTSGAAAALTLAAAAAIAGLDPGKMNRLPDTAGMANEIVCLRRHRNDYDHALRAAGARMVEVGFSDWTFPYELDDAIGPSTCALFYLASDPDPSYTLEDAVRIAHLHRLPVIVDASVALPPASNLRDIPSTGADLVAFSGGKHIEGPQASGFLCGREDLILSAALQHQDMDVYPRTWPRRSLIERGVLAGPPHHGIGRGFKVGKEEIVGLVAALRRYPERDAGAEYARWQARVDELAEALVGVPGIDAVSVDPRPGERPSPRLEIAVDPTGGLDAHDLINALQEGDPIICLYELAADRDVAIVLPESLLEGDPAVIAARIAAVMHSAPRSGAVGGPEAARR